VIVRDLVARHVAGAAREPGDTDPAQTDFQELRLQVSAQQPDLAALLFRFAVVAADDEVVEPGQPRPTVVVITIASTAPPSTDFTAKLLLPSDSTDC
jgi:hypothetical protein